MKPQQVAAQIRRTDTPQWRPWWGKVTATAAGPPATISVTVNGATTATTGIRYLAGYTPAVNDVVCGWVVYGSRGPDYVALGKLA